jgi:hypothetical protein
LARCFLLFAPLGLGAIYLLTATLREEVEDLVLESALLYVPLVLLGVLPLVLAFFGGPLFGGVREAGRAGAARRMALVSPCVLAPLAVTYAWTLAPAPLGIGIGGYRFFLHWLTKYPNLGCINQEVFLGIGCVILCSFLPAPFAACAVARPPKRTAAIGILIAEYLTYGAVLVVLDGPTVQGVLLDGLGLRPWLVVYLVSGPLLRAAAAVVMGLVVCGECLKYLRSRRSREVEAGRAERAEGRPGGAASSR